MKGAGIWLRSHRDLTPEAAATYLDFVVTPLHSGDGGIVRGPLTMKWCAEYRRLGGELYGMDWLPHASGGIGHIAPMMDLARELGCVGAMADCEPDSGWRHALLEAKRYARAFVMEAGDDLEVSLTDWGGGGMDSATTRAMLSVIGTGVPQSYDPAATYALGYHQSNVDHWRERGAQQIVVGLGLWLRKREGRDGRHRDRAEFAKHLRGVPVGVDGVCAWYASTKVRRGDSLHTVTSQPLAAILPDLRKWSRGRFGVRETMPAPLSVEGLSAMGADRLAPAAFDRTRIADLAADAKAAGDEDAARVLRRAVIKLS